MKRLMAVEARTLTITEDPTARLNKIPEKRNTVNGPMHIKFLLTKTLLERDGFLLAHLMHLVI